MALPPMHIQLKFVVVCFVSQLFLPFSVETTLYHYVIEDCEKNYEQFSRWFPYGVFPDRDIFV